MKESISIISCESNIERNRNFLVIIEFENKNRMISVLQKIDQRSKTSRKYEEIRSIIYKKKFYQIPLLEIFLILSYLLSSFESEGNPIFNNHCKE